MAILAVIMMVLGLVWVIVGLTGIVNDQRNVISALAEDAVIGEEVIDRIVEIERINSLKEVKS